MKLCKYPSTDCTAQCSMIGGGKMCYMERCKGRTQKDIISDMAKIARDVFENAGVPPAEIENYKNTSYSSNYQDPDETILPPEEIIEIRSALAFLPSDDRDLWVKIGMCLKSTGSASAFGLWNEWSQKSDKYNPSEMEKRWQTLKPVDVTIATLFHEVKKIGWVTT